MPIRFVGTNVNDGKRILRESGLPITPAESFEDAAIQATSCLKS